MGSKIVLGLVSSPNREGTTNQLVRAALDGACAAGADTELVQLADYVVAPCRDCLPWICRTNMKCTYEDPAFEQLSEKILDCGALVVGTPVYFWDTTALFKYLVLKMLRVYAMSRPLDGFPALGIAMAGDSGNGLVSGLRPLYHFFFWMRMRAIEPLPVTRFDFTTGLERARELGAELPGLIRERRPFTGLDARTLWYAGLDERMLWYDSLPYLDLDRLGERRLLASVTAAAIPESGSLDALRGLASADVLTAAHRTSEAAARVARVYQAGVKAFEAG